MTKKTFFAEQWLRRDIESSNNFENCNSVPGNSSAHSSKIRFPTFAYQQPQRKIVLEANDKFSPLNCFVPGWKGDSLPSKTIIKFNRLLDQVQQDIRNELFKSKDFPKSIKMAVYNEFLSYAESLGLRFEGLDDFGRFWQFIDPEKLEEEKNLSQFIDIYSGRVASITFYRLRFISALLDQSGIELSNKALLYPTSFLSQIFKKGSLLELNAKALESNEYSWYRPNEGMIGIMRELVVISRELAVTEITKNVSFRTQVPQDHSKTYSHALSHLSFGLFLNSLQINFPLWLDAINSKAILPGGNEEEIISCKYFGDYLESLSLSHWLAQENNKSFKWDQILCPDFKGLEFISGTFAKICNELQFLTFLVHKAEHQGERPIEYISKIMSGHFCNRKNTSSRQGLLLEENPFYSSTYDRIVLNLFNFPKNNPQHYLMTQILEQVKYLKPNGYLFVLSSKKLFVPSLRERLEPVLRELKTEAIFDLDNVKGKGELGSYIYVFRKKVRTDLDRQLCSYFRISAELESFQQLSSLTEHLRSFYLSHLDEVPAMAHLEFSDTFRVEFYQDAIVNGMLIQSGNEDHSRITHPSYFKGLLDNCVPLDTLFDIKPLFLDEKIAARENALNLGLKRDLSYFLVVDFRSSEVNLELHPMDTFRSIHSDYGQTLCSYFQLHSKFPGLNPNVLRNYFLTPVGKQVANLTFTGGLSLVKGSLSKFLVPKFLTETESLPAHLKTAFEVLEINEDEILDTSPQRVLKAFNHIDQITRDLFPKYACDVLSRFSNLERTLQSLIWKMDDSRFGQKISFNNSLIQNKLVQKPTRPLYPENPDIFPEFVDSSPMDLHLPLTQTQMRVTHEGELKLYSLELISHDKIIVRIHGEELMINFIGYILSQAVDIPIAKVLKAVHIPSLEDLKEVVDTSQSFKIVYQELLDRVQRSILEAFRLHVTPKRNT